MDYLSIGRRLFREDLMRSPGWSEQGVQIWVRDHGRCVFCGTDMLQSYDVAYYYSHHDHLLPKSKYGELLCNINNLVLSCKACNEIKHTFDPNVESAAPGDAAPQLVYTSGSGTLTEAAREELIRRVQVHLRGQRGEYPAKFEAQKKAILRAIRGGEEAAAAGAA